MELKVTKNRLDQMIGLTEQYAISGPLTMAELLRIPGLGKAMIQQMLDVKMILVIGENSYAPGYEVIHEVARLARLGNAEFGGHKVFKKPEKRALPALSPYDFLSLREEFPARLEGRAMYLEKIQLTSLFSASGSRLIAWAYNDSSKSGERSMAEIPVGDIRIEDGVVVAD